MLASLLLLQTQSDTIVPVPRNDDWWKKRHEASVARAKQGDANLVFIGDSITHSFGGPIWDKYYGPRKPMNLGFSGDRTQHVIWRLQNGEMDGVKPKVVVMMIGTNNQSANTPEQTALGVQAIVTWLRQHQRQAKIVMLDIFPRDPNPDNVLRRKVEATNRLLQDIREVQHVNINDVFLDEFGKLSRDIMPDFLHPNQEGYQRWADALEPTLKKYF